MKSIRESIFDDDDIIQGAEEANVDMIKNIMSKEKCYNADNFSMTLNGDFIDITSPDRNHEVFVYGEDINADTELVGEYIDNIGKLRFNGDINMYNDVIDRKLLGSNIYGKRIYAGSANLFGEYSVGDECYIKDMNFTILKQNSTDFTTSTSISPYTGQFVVTTDFEFKNVNINFDYNYNKVANHHCISIHHTDIKPVNGLNSNAKMLVYNSGIKHSNALIDDMFSSNSNNKTIYDVLALLTSRKRIFELPLVEFKPGINFEKILGLSGLPELEYVVVCRNKYNIVFYKPSKIKLCQYIMGDPILDGVYKKRLELLPKPTADGWTMFTYRNR